MLDTVLGAEVLGRREKNKLDKLRRIREAARGLFISKGFDDTTTREIASRAEVGIGTIFLYADNKRDLLFLVVNNELEEATACAEAAVREETSALQNLLTAFREHYKLFARQPALSRLILREMTFYDEGRQAARFQATRERVIGLVGNIFEMAMRDGSLTTTEKPDFVGWVAFSIYQVQLRRWLTSNDLDLDKGIAELERALRLFLRGLHPTKQAMLRFRTGTRLSSR